MNVVAHWSHIALSSVIDSKNVFSLVCTSDHRKKTIGCKFGVIGHHKADVHMVDFAVAHHFHGPSEQELILVCAGGVIKKDG